MECKTKFHIDVEFTFSFKGGGESLLGRLWKGIFYVIIVE